MVEELTWTVWSMNARSIYLLIKVGARMANRQLGGFQFKIGTATNDGGRAARQCLDLGIEFSTQAWVSEDWGPDGSKELFDLEVGGKQSWIVKWPLAALLQGIWSGLWLSLRSPCYLPAVELPLAFPSLYPG